MKAWITKYALSKGVIVIECDDPAGTNFPGMVSGARSGIYTHFHGEGREWHRTGEEATKRAEEMRAAKIASLRKQIAKLEALTFDSRNAA